MTDKLYICEDGITREYNEAEYTEYYAQQAAMEALRPKQEALAEISRLEALITPRRIREAILGDNGWLANIESQISALREQL